MRDLVDVLFLDRSGYPPEQDLPFVDQLSSYRGELAERLRKLSLP